MDLRDVHRKNAEGADKVNLYMGTQKMAAGPVAWPHHKSESQSAYTYRKCLTVKET